MQLKHPHLVFTVSNYLRRGNRFDIDNLSKLVLDEVGKDAETVWVEVLLGGEPGTLIADRRPLPRLSQRGRFLWKMPAVLCLSKPSDLIGVNDEITGVRLLAWRENSKCPT